MLFLCCVLSINPYVGTHRLEPVFCSFCCCCSAQLHHIMGSLCGLFLVCSDPLQLIQDQDALFSRVGKDDAKSATSDPDDDTEPRVRRRFTSSPKTMAKVAMMTPSLTPISLFLFPGLIPSVSDREHNTTPAMTDYSRLLSTSQLSQLYQSLPAGSRIQPWSLLYSLSKDGCSLQTLYSKIIFENCNLLLILQVFYYTEHSVTT